MTIETPWQGDACSLVEAFRSGERNPVDELEAVLAALESSGLNAFSHVDAHGARAAARAADVSLAFGGVPMGVKEMEAVSGWPDTRASVPLKDRVATRDAVFVERLRKAGSVLVGLTTSSEFGGVNVSRSKLNGVTRNPWGLEHTAGGSSAGAAASVAGGLVTIGSAGDGGGSIRIPGAMCGLPGLKGTYGRYPRGPVIGSMVTVLGCLSRSVRDITRWLDATSGHHATDPFSLPRVEGWESHLGSDLARLRGKRVAIVPDLGAAVVHSGIVARVREHGAALATDAGLEVVDVPVKLPDLATEWALSGLSTILMELGDRYPDCEADLTFEIAFGLKLAHQMYSFEARSRVEASRKALNQAMAEVFDAVDFVICATNPDVAFTADGPMPLQVEGQETHLANHGALTIPSNVYGNPAISIPVGTLDGLPIGMQVLAAHHREADLLDLALIAERERPWPLVAPA